MVLQDKPCLRAGLPIGQCPIWTTVKVYAFAYLSYKSSCNRVLFYAGSTLLDLIRMESLHHLNSDSPPDSRQRNTDCVYRIAKITAALGLSVCPTRLEDVTAEFKALDSDHSLTIQKLPASLALPLEVHWRILGDRTIRLHCVYPRELPPRRYVPFVHISPCICIGCT